MKLIKPSKETFHNLIKHPLAQIFLIAAGLNLIVDSFSRESFFDACAALAGHPLVFLYNTLIIAITLVPALFFSRRIFAYIVASLLWIIVGITDFILLQFRTTPFTFVDITMIKSAFSIWNHYLSIPQLIFIALLLLAAIAGCAVLFYKCRKAGRLPFLRVLTMNVIMAAVAIVSTDLGVRLQILSENFGNLADAYHRYGLPYCFVSSIINTGIPKPKNYSDEYVQQILRAIEDGTLVTSANAVGTDGKQGADGTEPGNEGTKPGTESSNPNVEGTKPGNGSSNPDAEGTKPGNGSSNPDAEGTKPGTEPGKEERPNAPAPGITGSPEGSSDTPTPALPLPTAEPDTEPTPEASPSPKPHSDTPNIIFLQLESFFDPTTILGSSFSEDPIPSFHSLMESFTSGYLSVPSVGAGTANTEFEVITGMNLDFFGPGEYPYKTILKETTCESISYILKESGYRTHAIHNNDGTFYERHIIFSQLGFDTFSSIEYMNDVERTPLDWAKDFVLTSEIAKTLSSTPEPDFVYTISVQGHGSYPTESILAEPAINLTLPEDFSEESYYQVLYYTNQIHEMDEFVAELIQFLEGFPEDTVLVMYGDHLPGLKLSEEQLSNQNLFQTPYVMWSNFELEAEHEGLEAYQLYSYVLDRLDIHDGIINKFHQTQRESDIYLEDLEILEYDMLYGDRTSFQGANPYEATKLQMGIEPIQITDIRAFAASQSNSAEANGDSKTDGQPEYTVFLNGNGFTPYSVVQVNGKNVSTMFVSDTVLSAIMPLPEEGAEITVAQQGTDEQILSVTEPFLITAEVLSRIFPKENPSLEGED